MKLDWRSLLPLRVQSGAALLGFGRADLAGSRPQFVVVTFGRTPISMAPLILNNKMLVFCKTNLRRSFLRGNPAATVVKNRFLKKGL